MTSFSSPEDLVRHFRSNGCDLCPLGSQRELNGPVVFRGNPSSHRMIIGEAPGKIEDTEGRPFVGPAGVKLDEILRCAGIDTNRDFYIGNIIKCRPIAPSNSGKENLTPTVEHVNACRPFIVREIELVQPDIIVLQGLSAVRALLGLTARM